MASSGTLSKNTYYEELKPISDVDKEYIDEHQSDSKILLYDSEPASVESEESDNEEPLNLGSVWNIKRKVVSHRTFIKVWQERKV